MSGLKSWTAEAKANPLILLLVTLWCLSTSPAAGAPAPEAIQRGPADRHRLALVFTGNEFAEGGETILNELSNRQTKASFFLTGDFLANTNFRGLVKRILGEGHYLGPHSDRHLLYCTWGDKTTLVSREQFRTDLGANLKKIEALGVSRLQARFFLPPYEHYNGEVARWTKEMGLVLVNYTPGTRSPADYTVEGNRNFVPSETIFQSIVARESADTQGLNGFILLLHLGAGSGRTDKFHFRFSELMSFCKSRGYEMVRIDALLAEHQ